METTAYSSISYRVESNEHGVEITNLHTGDIAWITNFDPRCAELRVAELSDRYLSRYFD
jgi:hypothetical protein